jgi:uncharacterized protein (TIGR03435 family)
MQIRSKELLAVGILGGGSSLSGRIETLLRGGRTFSPRASGVSVAMSVIALGALMLAGTLAPRWIAFAQQPARPAFEVVSVKPNTSQDFRQGIQLDVSPAGKLTSKNIPLLMTIATAYNIPFQSSRLTGAPDWLGRDRFDIEATPPADAFPATLSGPARDAKLRAMLQSLLADRFKLAIRRETKVAPVYAIVVGKKGPRLEKSKVEEKDCPQDHEAIGGGLATSKPAERVSCHGFNGGQGRGLHGDAVDISDLAIIVSNWTDRPVVDKTGLRGLYHIETKPWIPMRLGPAPAAGAKAEDGSEVADLPTLFTVFENLGLKLEAQQAPVEYFVIDHIERPDAN